MPVFCNSCGASLGANDRFCAECGQTVRMATAATTQSPGLNIQALRHPYNSRTPTVSSSSQNRLEFSAAAIPFFVRYTLLWLSALIYVPAAEQLTRLLKYVVAHLRFADGTTLSYNGSADDVKQPLLGITLLLWATITLSLIFDGDAPSNPLFFHRHSLVGIALVIGASVANGYFAYQLLRAIAPHLTTNKGSHLRFAGTLEKFLSWQLMAAGCTMVPSLIGFLLPKSGFLGGLVGIALTALNLILLAFVTAAFSRWLASQLAGGSRMASFDAQPIQITLRSAGLLLLVMLVVTIPWAILWYMKWYMRQYSLPARTAMPVGGSSVRPGHGIDAPLYCAQCGKPGTAEALFCTSCGAAQ